MDKPKIGTHYYYIDLNDDWSVMEILSKDHVLDQIDRYNLAAGNWALSKIELESKADLLLQSMTRMENVDIARLLFDYRERHAKE